MEAMQGDPTPTLAKLGTASFSEVSKTFETVRQPRHSRDLGGYATPARVPYYKPGDTIFSHILQTGKISGPVQDTHHVQTSFTPEQSKYISMVNAYLVNLTRGKSFADTNLQLLPLSQRIIDNFIQQSEPRYFSLAVMESVLDLYATFQEVYPNIMPALHAMFHLAGAEGSEVAIRLTSDFLQEEMRNSSPSSDFNRTPHFHADFVMPHGRGDKQPQEMKQVEFEVWCGAEAVAQAIGYESLVAAEKLGKYPNITNLYSETINERDCFDGRKFSLMQHKYIYLYDNQTDQAVQMTDVFRRHVNALWSKTSALQEGR